MMIGLLNVKMILIALLIVIVLQEINFILNLEFLMEVHIMVNTYGLIMMR